MIKHLQKILNSEIPITKHMGITVGENTNNSLKLHAPLRNNINHKNTAFGGSIYSVAVLSGWGLVYLLLDKHQLSGHIVIQESNIKYIKPITTDLTAECKFTSFEQQERFIKIYKRKHLARIHLSSTIKCKDEIAVNFNGTYVVHQ